MITVSRKPFGTTTTDNVKTHECGGINIDGCRIPTKGRISKRKGGGDAKKQYGMKLTVYHEHKKGRYPLNFLLSIHTQSIILEQSENLTSVHSASTFFKVIK